MKIETSGTQGRLDPIVKTSEPVFKCSVPLTGLRQQPKEDEFVKGKNDEYNL